LYQIITYNDRTKHLDVLLIILVVRGFLTINLSEPRPAHGLLELCVFVLTNFINT